MALGFGQVEEILALAFDVPPQYRSRLRARLQQWQKMRFPKGVNAGRGSRAEYGATQVFQLAAMLSLLDAGLHPERGKDAILATWSTIRAGLGAAAVSGAHRAFDTVYCFLKLDGLDKLRDPKTSSGFVAYLRRRTQLADAIKRPEDVPMHGQAAWVARTLYAMEPATSSLILDLDYLLNTILASMKLVGANISDMSSDFNHWASSYEVDELHIENPAQFSLDNITTQEWVAKYVRNTDVQVGDFDDLCREILGIGEHRRGDR